MKVLICDAISKDAVEGLKGLGIEVVENTSVEKEELAGVIADFDGVSCQYGCPSTKQTQTDSYHNHDKLLLLLQD